MKTSEKPSILFYNFGAKFGGAEIVLLKYLEKPSQYFDFKVLLNEQGTFYDKLIKSGISVEVIGTQADLFYSVKRGDPFSLNLFKLIPAVIQLFYRVVRYFKKNNFDLVVSNTYKSHIILGLAAKFFKVKAVWRFHDIVQREYTFYQFSWFNIKLMKYLVSSITKILSVSQAVTDSFLDFGFDPAKFAVVHNGLDGIKGRSNDGFRDLNQLNIGWIGQFAAWKGIEEFIRLCKALIDHKDNIQPDFQFVIAGSALFGNESYEKQIEKMVEGSYKSYFTFLGHVSDSDAFYQRIDIYFHTSIAPDPFPTTVLEAGSRGLLVFASELGGAREIVSDDVTGFLINMRDENTTLKKTIEVLNNFKQHRDKGAKLQARINDELSLVQYRAHFEAEVLKAIQAS
ncbi:MAG: glycosyltransferase family 4 protein [Candidatus Marinimicrobia bacterium]|nr:glycosyltransferase family 4 protein [Candidatus Neomarinimicrobiota bacterium]